MDQLEEVSQRIQHGAILKLLFSFLFSIDMDEAPKMFLSSCITVGFCTLSAYGIDRMGTLISLE